MRKLLFLFVVCLSGCYNPTNIDDRLNEVIDSLNNESHIVSFYQKDMGKYYLFTISNEIGPLYDEYGNIQASEVRNVGNENIIVYSSTKNLAVVDENKIKEIESLYTIPHHTVIWYFAITKDGREEFLIQPVNSSVMPYEIPSVRNFMNPSKEVKGYEYIIDYISVITEDSLQTANIGINIKQYNRLDKNKSINNFSFIWQGDTLQFKIDTLSLYSSYIDDTLWVEDSFLTNRYHLHLELRGKNVVSKFQEQDSIKSILEESILVGEKMNDIEIIIPSDIPINMQRNGKWIE